MEECRRLRDMKSRAYDHSKLLLQAIAVSILRYYTCTPLQGDKVRILHGEQEM